MLVSLSTFSLVVVKTFNISTSHCVFQHILQEKCSFYVLCSIYIYYIDFQCITHGHCVFFWVYISSHNFHVDWLIFFLLKTIYFCFIKHNLIGSYFQKAWPVTWRRSYPTMFRRALSIVGLSQIFHNAEHFTDALCSFFIKQNFDFTFMKNDK